MNHERYHDPTADTAIRNIERNEKKMVDTMTVYRGDIFYINKSGYAVGSEQESRRPAVIVSNDTGNENSTCVEIVYLTTQKKDKAYLPTHVSVVARAKSTAMCEQIFTVSKERLGEYVRSCTEKEMKAIDKALAVSLGLDRATADNAQPVEAPPADPAVSEIDQEKEDLKNMYAEAKNHAEMMEKRAIEAETKMHSLNDELRKAEVKKDTFKDLYEELLERLIG